MTATALLYSYTPTHRSPAPLFVLSIILLATIGLVYSHAAVKHGTEAEQVRNCLKDRGAVQVWENPFRENMIQVCEIQPGVFGLRVVAKIHGKWEELTAYVKNKAHCLNDIERILSDQGAFLRWSK